MVAGEHTFSSSRLRWLITAKKMVHYLGAAFVILHLHQLWTRSAWMIRVKFVANDRISDFFFIFCICLTAP